MRAQAWPRILAAAIAATTAVFASLALRVPESVAGKGPAAVVNRRGYPKLAVLRAGAAPTDPVALEALHRNFMQADLLVFQGNRGKWWTLPVDASGFTARAYNRRMKIFQYLPIDAFPVSPPSGAEIVPPPTDPEAALHTRSFTREEYYDLARALGSTVSFTTLIPLDPKWAGTITRADYGDVYAEWVMANWKSTVFRNYVKSALAAVAAAGFNGMFFDFGSLTYMNAYEGHWTTLPPNCFRLAASGWWYWMSFPGQYFEGYGPPPDVDALRAMDPAALSAVADPDSCRTTGMPAEIASMEDAEAMIIDFYRDLRVSSRLTLVYNGASEQFPRRNDIALVNAHGGHQEGYGFTFWPPDQIRQQFDMVESFNTKKKIFVAWNKETSVPGRIYAYAACMIPGGIQTYCEFTDQIPDVPEIRLDPGKPRGRYVTLPAGETDLEKIVYKRTWTKAVMYLNPTTSSISVDGLTLGPKTALVLPPPPR